MILPAKVAARVPAKRKLTEFDSESDDTSEEDTEESDADEDNFSDEEEKAPGEDLIELDIQSVEIDQWVMVEYDGQQYVGKVKCKDAKRNESPGPLS